MNWMCSSRGEYDEMNTNFWWRNLFWNTDTCRSETFKTVFKAEGTYIRDNIDCFSHRAQAYVVQLPPDFNCSDCTIRLMRQAEEWGKSYRFWSCADVDILSSK